MEICDLPSVFALRLSTNENAITMEELEQDYGITPESLSEAMKLNMKGWLSEDSGNVVGIAMGDVSRGEVVVVAVHPEYERRGIGRHLLEHVQSWLFSEGHQEIWLLTNPDPNIRATGFYRRFGWHATGELRDGDEILKLQRSESNG
jgi:ribosomal protein S18 acetylase RimI-like enzyme